MDIPILTTRRIPAEPVSREQGLAYYYTFRKRKRWAYLRCLGAVFSLHYFYLGKREEGWRMLIAHWSIVLLANVVPLDTELSKLIGVAYLVWIFFLFRDFGRIRRWVWEYNLALAHECGLEAPPDAIRGR